MGHPVKKVLALLVTRHTLTSQSLALKLTIVPLILLGIARFYFLMMLLLLGKNGQSQRSNDIKGHWQPSKKAFLEPDHSQGLKKDYVNTRIFKEMFVSYWPKKLLNKDCKE